MAMRARKVWNVAKASGELMLGMWCEKSEAEKGLQHYLTKYAPGKPYPNGKGFYKDEGYHLVRRERGTNHAC